MAEYELPEEISYSKDDEWVRRDGDNVVIGITDFAQSQLGDIVFVELPEVGATTEAGTPFGTIESVKAVSDLVAPLSGKVIAINEALEDTPESVNESCYDSGWMIQLQPADEAEFADLLEAKQYRSLIDERES